MEVVSANCRDRVSECTGIGQLYLERPLKVDREIDGLETLIAELHKVFSNRHVDVQEVQKLMCAYKSDPRHWRKYAKFDRFRYTRNLVDTGNGAFNIMVLCWGPGHASSIHDHADAHCFMKLLSGSLVEVKYDWPSNVESEVHKKLKTISTKRLCSDTEDDTTEIMTNLQIDCGTYECRNFSQNSQRSYKNDHYLSNQDAKNLDSKTYKCVNNSQQNHGNFHNGFEIDHKKPCDNSCHDVCDDEEEGYDPQHMEEVGRTILEPNDVCYINDALGLHRMENPSHVDGAVSLHLYSPPFDSCRAFDSRTGKATQVQVTFWSINGKKIKKVIAADPADGQE